MGGRSRAAAQLLSGQGYKDVYNLVGGMNAWQGLTAAGPADMGMIHLRGDETPVEMGVLAYGLEEGLADFYSRVAGTTQEADVAHLLTDLAGIEEKHKARVFDLCRALDPTVAEKETFESKTVSHMMEGGFTTDEFLEQNRDVMQTLDGVLNMAMMLETQGLDLYMRYAHKSEDEKSRNVLLEIAEDEKAHLEALGRLIEEKAKEDKMEDDTKVKMYTLSTCSHCKATKRFLDECAVQYDFTDVDLLEGEERAAILEDVRKLNPRCSFPTIIIGDKIIVGFKENEIKEALGL